MGSRRYRYKTARRGVNLPGAGRAANSDQSALPVTPLPITSAAAAKSATTGQVPITSAAAAKSATVANAATAAAAPTPVPTTLKVVPRPPAPYCGSSGTTGFNPTNPTSNAPTTGYSTAFAGPRWAALSHPEFQNCAIEDASVTGGDQRQQYTKSSPCHDMQSALQVAQSDLQRTLYLADAFNRQIGKSVKGKASASYGLRCLGGSDNHHINNNVNVVHNSRPVIDNNPGLNGYGALPTGTANHSGSSAVPLSYPLPSSASSSVAPATTLTGGDNLRFSSGSHSSSSSRGGGTSTEVLMYQSNKNSMMYQYNPNSMMYQSNKRSEPSGSVTMDHPDDESAGEWWMLPMLPPMPKSQ